MRLRLPVLLTLLVIVSCLPGWCDIGLLLDAKPNSGMQLGNEITGEGHAGVYLSNVCIVTPVQLRPCEPGELGAVIQNYTDYKEDKPYEWNAVPLPIYLYGAEDLRDRPLFGSPELRSAFQQQYRLKYLKTLCTTKTCLTDPEANWRDSVAAAFVREIYIFEVKTTPEQDAQFIREFNARANVNHYSGFKRNCADFAKLVVNTYFPHSAHRDVMNDFGMTGPKAIARSFTHYAEHHPELDLRVIRVEQVPGTYKRSSDCREGTEQTVRSARWLVPLAIVSYQAIPVLAASYFLTGRFSPEREVHQHPSEQAALLNGELKQARRDDDDKADTQRLKKELRAEQQHQVGDEQEWEKYHERFEEVLRTAIADGVVSNRGELRNLFRGLQARGKVSIDDQQQVWLQLERNGELRRVGLSADNVLSSQSDRDLAFQLLLARTEYLLDADSKHRELYPEFQRDWELLQQSEEVLTGRAKQVIASRQ
jgi:hypothetical protein